MPFNFFSRMGLNLLQVDGCLRLSSVEHDLRQSDHFSSARLELEIAAALARAGHSVEFRPPLSTGKEADLGVHECGGQTFFEIKLMHHSEALAAVEPLRWQIADALSEPHLRHFLAGPAMGCEVEIAPAVLELLGAGPEADRAACAKIFTEFGRALEEHLNNSEPTFDFWIGSYLHMRVAPGIQSCISGPILSPQSDLKRIVQKHFKKPIEQLPKTSPGILVIQPPSVIEPPMAVAVIQELMRNWAANGAHLSAAVFLPISGTESVPWRMFQPFAVFNPHAAVAANDLPSFVTLAEAYDVTAYREPTCPTDPA